MITVSRFRRALLRAWVPLVIGSIAAACKDSTGPSNAATPTSGYTITVRFVDPTPPTQAVRDAFAQAVAKWESVIIDSVGSIYVTLATGTCDSVQPALNETIKDVLILVHIQPLLDSMPGQTLLGEAGPCLIRQPGNLPILGVMSLNSGALTLLASQRLLTDVITHEIAHLLGFGTVWDLDSLLQGATTNDPWFSGKQAQAAFRRALPSYTGKIVPVEANGGAGTTQSHWRESVMANELMTGFLNSGVNPLSAITIESMADLGYTVNVAVAEPWPTLSTHSGRVSPDLVAALSPGTTSAAGSGTHTALGRPRFWVSRSGAIIPLPGPRAPVGSRRGRIEEP